MRLFSAASSFALLALLLLALPGCVMQPPAKKDAAPALALRATGFDALPGWSADRPAEALAPLQKSCDRILKAEPSKVFGPAAYAGAYADWQAVCAKLPGPGGDPAADDAAARRFFTENFTPYEIWDAEAPAKTAREGEFTGYYEPILHGALRRKKPYLIPLYARPKDLITVNLGDFKPALKGETVMGRVKKDRLVPYYTRTEIDRGALKKQHKVVWVDNAIDAFFLHIQGSGEVVLPHHKILQVGYAAENGRPYYAIGRELIKRGALTKQTVSMQSIRAWLEANPKEAAKVMDLDNSFIFFRKIDTDGGPLGAEGVPLTPGRSLAVDHKRLPYGAPLWLDADAPAAPGQPPGARLQRVMIAQDTGGAITGAVRGDYFWGAGEEAANDAGLMKSGGHSYIFLPKTVAVPENFLLNHRPAEKSSAPFQKWRWQPFTGGSFAASKIPVYNN